jgi:hypothetical protein
MQDKEQEIRNRNMNEPCDTCGAAPQEECSYTLHGVEQELPADVEQDLAAMEVSEEAYEAADHELGPQFYTTAIYVTNRQYGGAEEGGWWYDVGEPAEEPSLAVLTKVFLTSADARRYADTLQGACDRMNKGRYSPGSVLCSGWYEARVTRGYPKEYPETRPHYE